MAKCIEFSISIHDWSAYKREKKNPLHISTLAMPIFLLSLCCYCHSNPKHEKIWLFVVVGVCGYFSFFFCSALIFDCVDCASARCGRKRQCDCVVVVLLVLFVWTLFKRKTIHKKRNEWYINIRCFIKWQKCCVCEQLCANSPMTRNYTTIHILS